MTAESSGTEHTIEERNNVMNDIRSSIDDVTLEAWNKIDPDLSAELKALQPEDIVFGESLKLRKYLFSGQIRLGSIQQYKKSSYYNSSSNTLEDTSGWRAIQYFTDKKFTNYAGWLIYNAEYDYIRAFKNDIADFYRVYSMEINDGGGRFNPDSVFASNNPEKQILTVADKKLAAMNLALSFGEKLVFASTVTNVGEFRCGAVSLDSYTCTETDEYATLPICPIFFSRKDGTKVPIGAYLRTQKKIHIQFYGKEDELKKAKQEIFEERRKERKRRHLRLGLKIGGWILTVAIAAILALIFML